MNFKRACVIVVDAYSTGNLLAPAFFSAGYDCVHVRSTDKVRDFYRSAFRPGDFSADIIFTNMDDLKLRLNDRQVLHALPGCEFAVELAAEIAAEFELENHNDPQFSQRWRNKYVMHEALKAAGVRSIDHFASASLSDIVNWIGGRDTPYPIVLKPIDSAGTDNVHICMGRLEAESAFHQIQGSKNLFEQANEIVLAQEYLVNEDYHGRIVNNDKTVDVEFCINTVSHKGRHFVSEIIRVFRTRYNDSPVHDYNQLLCPIEDADTYRELSSYVFSVLDALQIKNGPGHSELMIVRGQPVLLETAARLPGGVDFSAYEAAQGHSQVHLYLMSLLNPEAFLRYIDQPRKALRKQLSCVFLISSLSGQIVRPPTLDLGASALRSLHSLKLQSSGYLKRTISLVDSPGSIFLVSADREQIARDRNSIRLLEDDLYAGMIG